MRERKNWTVTVIFDPASVTAEFEVWICRNYGETVEVNRSARWTDKQRCPQTPARIRDTQNTKDKETCHVTTVHKRSQSFCHKCRWQVTAKHACTHAYGFAWSNVTWRMVVRCTQNTLWRQQFHVAQVMLTHLAPDRPLPPALFLYRKTPDRPVAAS